MNDEEYYQVQVETHGHILKPAHYHHAERRAIDAFASGIKAAGVRSATVLDVGCGIGLGMHYFQERYGCNTWGIELNPKKAAIGQLFGLNVIVGDMEDAELPIGVNADLVFSSHSLEHVRNPDKAIENMLRWSKRDALLCFVLPYQDTGDPKAHIGSEKIGLRTGEWGVVASFFSDCELEIQWRRFETLREPEVWVQTRRKD